MVRFLLLSLWILAIGGGRAQKISGQTVYKAHVSDAEGNAVEYATAVLLSGEKQVGVPWLIVMAILAWRRRLGSIGLLFNVSDTSLYGKS